MRASGQPDTATSVHSGSEGGDYGRDAGIQHLKLFFGGMAQSGPTEEAVGRQSHLPEQLRQGAGPGSLGQLKLQGPVLALAKAEPEEHVKLILGFNHRDAVTVAADGNRPAGTLYHQGTAGNGQPGTQQQSQQGAAEGGQGEREP